MLKINSSMSFFTLNVHCLPLKCINYFTREFRQFHIKIAKNQYIVTVGLIWKTNMTSKRPLFLWKEMIELFNNLIMND